MDEVKRKKETKSKEVQRKKKFHCCCELVQSYNLFQHNQHLCLQTVKSLKWIPIKESPFVVIEMLLNSILSAKSVFVLTHKNTTSN